MIRGAVVAAVILAAMGCRFKFAPGLEGDPDAQPPNNDSGVACTPLALPQRPSSGPRAGSSRWFVLDHLFLGFTTPDGNRTDNAWKCFGLNLDGRVTTRDDLVRGRNSCRARIPGSSTTLIDGPNGLDNRFPSAVGLLSENLLGPSGIEHTVNNTIKAGSRTWILRLDAAMNGDNQTAGGAFYNVGPFAGGMQIPSFGPGESWPVVATSLADGKSIDKPNVTFPDGYVRDGIWVSGSPRRERLVLDLRAAVPIERAVLAVRLADGAGIVAGAMTVTAAHAAWRRARPECDPAWMLPNLEGAADLVMGAPTLNDETVACDAISVGIGFHMKETTAPIEVVAAPPDNTTDPCAAPDGGVGDTDASDAGAG